MSRARTSLNFRSLALPAALLLVCAAVYLVFQKVNEQRMLRLVIERLTADSRAANVLVSAVKTDPLTKKTLTTIKFLEFDTAGEPLEPRYFTFSGNIIQFQSLVIRFDDLLVKQGHPLKGKSAYIFMKVFSLDNGRLESYDINTVNEIPSGYRVQGARNPFEKRLWERFWTYALDPEQAKLVGVKNAQIEAPGTRFVPGLIYTLTIEHDGGLRIDAQQLPRILKGERVDF